MASALHVYVIYARSYYSKAWFGHIFTIVDVWERIAINTFASFPLIKAMKFYV